MIGILELGSQSTHLIEHRLNELGYHTKLSTNLEDLKESSAIIYSGSHLSVQEAKSFEPLEGIPSFFICFAFQQMMAKGGGKVVRKANSGYSERKIQLLDHALFSELESLSLTTWLSHSDSIESLASGWKALSEDFPVMIAYHQEKPWMGTQFHPEILHSINGSKIFLSFLHHYGVEPEFNIKSHLDRAKQSLQQAINDQAEVLIALSGGIDSSVCAKLCEKFLTNKIHLLCIDHGFLRNIDYRDLKENFGDRVQLIDASENFFAALEGVMDPEEKRKKIAYSFVQAFHQYIEQHPKLGYFIQGTIITDKIESGKTGGQKIKTHHNMLAIPENLKVIEPLDFLFKHQVRALGRELGMNERFTSRQPFPGPGLAIRCDVPVTRESIQVLQKADDLLQEFLEAEKIYPWQSLFVLLNSKAVGVKGDARVYEHVGVVKLVDSWDAISARAFELTHEQEKKLTLKLVNNLPIARLLFDKTPKPPGTIEWQ